MTHYLKLQKVMCKCDLLQPRITMISHTTLTLIAVGDTDKVTKVPAASYCTAAEVELRRL